MALDPRVVLRKPAVYNAFQILMGARRGRRQFIDRYVAPKSGHRILDIGCGTGLTVEFLPQDVSYAGFDGDQAYIEYAKLKYGHRASFRCHLIQDPNDLDGQKFDAVIATGVLHHIDDRTCSNLFQIAKNLLVPNGRLVTKDPCYFKEQRTLAKALVGYDRGQHVRFAEQYSELASHFFKRVEMTIENKAIPPYSHAIVVAYAESTPEAQQSI